MLVSGVLILLEWIVLTMVRVWYATLLIGNEGHQLNIVLPLNCHVFVSIWNRQYYLFCTVLTHTHVETLMFT